MDITQLLSNIQTPEQLEAMANKMAQFGAPPLGTPGLPQPPAQPNPLGISALPPAIHAPSTGLGDLING